MRQTRTFNCRGVPVRVALCDRGVTLTCSHEPDLVWDSRDPTFVQIVEGLKKREAPPIPIDDNDRIITVPGYFATMKIDANAHGPEIAAALEELLELHLEG